MYSRSVIQHLSCHGLWTAIADVESLFSSARKELFFKIDTYEMKLHMNNE